MPDKTQSRAGIGTNVYSASRGKVSIFGDDSFGNCENISYEHVLNSEWL
jgi:hypothetical protein